MEQKNTEYKIAIPQTLLLLLTYVVIAFIIPAIINMIFLNVLENRSSVWVNTFVQIVVNIIFFIALARCTKHRIVFIDNITPMSILIAVVCSLLLFLILDHFIDPILNRVFPVSGEEYRQMLETMRLTPIATFVQACLLTPVTEEILMRGYILHGLKNRYGTLAALFLSTVLFAVLHINIGQIISAFIGGFIIAMLYIKTKSISCCILAHVLYNSIEFYTTILL